MLLGPQGFTGIAMAGIDMAAWGMFWQSRLGCRSASFWAEKKDRSRLITLDANTGSTTNLSETHLAFGIVAHSSGVGLVALCGFLALLGNLVSGTARQRSCTRCCLNSWN
jgi:hypothetical protein